jgi:hypothetical protein
MSSKVLFLLVNCLLSLLLLHLAHADAGFDVCKGRVQEHDQCHRPAEPTALGFWRERVHVVLTLIQLNATRVGQP